MARRKVAPANPPVSLERLRFYEHLFHSAAMGALITDLAGKIIYTNPAIEQLLGWGTGALLGRGVEETVPPGTMPMFHRVLDQGQGWAGTVQRRRKSGAVLPTRVTISPIRDEFDQPLALIHFMADAAAEQRRRARLASLTTLGAALNAESDLDTLLERICQEARYLFRVDAVYLSRLDERANELIGWVGSSPFAEPPGGPRVPINNRTEGLRRAIGERCAVIQHHVRPEGDYADLIVAYRIHSCLLAPLRSGDRVLGLLSLIDTECDDRFGSEDAELAQAFADMAAAAIEGARLHEAERAKSERLETLARVNQLLAASLERGEVLEAVAAGAQRLLGVDDVVIRLLDGSTGRLRLAHYATKSGLVPWDELDLETSQLGQVVRNGTTWQSLDVMTERQGPDGTQRFWAAVDAELHGCLMVPLIARGRAIGGIGLMTREFRTFEPDEVELAEAFAAQAALAVRNAETLARERQSNRLEQILERSKNLSPSDRQHVEHLLAAAERVVELSVSGQTSGQ